MKPAVDTGYRFDIDGLRAIAVLAVLGYHVMPARLPGGYVGVDVFFVISGYLITRLLWRDLAGASFSLAGFYERRIRRLMPALVVMILACAVVEVWIGLPDEVRTFGWSAMASAVYLSNHYFLSQNDYFNDDMALNPLLHTWSLSVEEQFYLLFPLVLMLAYRYRRHALAGLVVLAVLSFLAGEVMLRINPSAAFYLMPTRLWELLLGGIVALAPHRAWSRWGAEGAVAVGLAMIAYSVVLFSEATPFPGMYALVPVVGAALVLVGGQTAGVGLSWLLSLSPARFLGKISYSVYLWHWPIVVFYKLQISPEPSSKERLGLIAASLLAGYLSWRLVEHPLRAPRGSRQPRIVWAGGVVATVVIMLVGGWFVLSEGGKSRFTGSQLGFISYLNYDADPHFRTNSCFLTSESDNIAYFDEADCVNYDPGRRNVMILGDSHAAQYYAGLVSRRPDVQFVQVTASGCRPVVGGEGEARCTELMAKAFSTYLAEDVYDAVILAGRWESQDLPMLPETVRMLSNRVAQVIVLGPIIEYRQALPRLLARHETTDAVVEAAQLYSEIKETDRLIHEAMQGTPGAYYSILDTLCDGRNCDMIASNGQPLQFDSSHLTYQGAVDVVGALLKQGMLR